MLDIALFLGIFGFAVKRPKKSKVKKHAPNKKTYYAI